MSRAPWLKAIALYAKGDTWGRGGFFTGPQTYWLCSDHRCVQDTTEVRRDVSDVQSQLCHDHWAGWRFHVEVEADGIKQGVSEKDLPCGWILRLKNRWYVYELEHVRSKTV